MKLLLSFFLLFFCFALFAQNEQNEAAAMTLHEEGQALLQQKPLLSFTKIEALEKFQQSQKLLHQNKIKSADLQAKNEAQIQAILDFFAPYQNSDSLLQLTRFFPDSVFQANTRYSNEIKLIINDLLTAKNSSLRKAFIKFRNINYFNNANQNTRPNFIITFEKSWPLAVIEFEEWLQQKETTLSSFKKNTREQLLYLDLQHQIDSLKNLEITEYYESNIRHLQENLEVSKKEKDNAVSEYQQYRNIGLGILACLLAIGYFFWQRNMQLLRSKNQSLLEEKKRSEDLLANMLPAEVVRQLKNKDAAKAHKYNSVCVLFSDFQNFSQISKNLPPEELVRELDYCFTTFDRIIEKYRLQKIKTIGDAYMCVGGLYTKGDQHIPRMVAAALEIQKFLKNRKIQRNALGSYFFEARIGVHTGPVVAGIIGTKKIAFDVWGDTVNVAQQMEHHSEAGKVNISGETYDLVKDKFECKHRGEITVKNKKVYDMYFVNKKIVSK